MVDYVFCVPSALPVLALQIKGCTTAFKETKRLQRVGSSNWKDGEAAVHRRLTLERQVTSTLLPDCAIEPPAAEAEEHELAIRQLSEWSSPLIGHYPNK